MQEPAPEAPNSNTEGSNTGVVISPLIGEDLHYNNSPIDLVKQSSSMMGHDSLIRDVWINNFFTAMEHIGSLIDDYNYIGMDTEFPGTVYVPQNTENEFEYNMIKANCDNLKLIQVGISLANNKGESPTGKTIAWQFNLQFDENTEQSIEDSMKLLKQSGFNFEKHKTDGIPHQLFAEYLISSGIIMNRRNHWITFHGGLDFGYLLKILSNEELPSKQYDFTDQLKQYFYNYYDVKEVKREIDYLSGGLGKVAREIGIDRIGTMHQAGSDAHLTQQVYFNLKNKLKKMWNYEQENKIEDRLNGKIYGICESINDEQYVEQYKLLSKKTICVDSTGYVNIRLLDRGYSSNQNDNQLGPNVSAPQGMPNRGHPNSAHGMLNQPMSSMNNMGINNNNGMYKNNLEKHHMGSNAAHPSSTAWMPPTNQGMLGSHPNMSQGLNGHGISNMGSLNHNSSTPVYMANTQSQLGAILQDNNIEMTGINQNSLMTHMNTLSNLNGYNPQMSSTNSMGMSQMSQQNPSAQSLQVNQQMMFLQQPTLLNNSNQLNSNIDENDIMNQSNQQYGRMNYNSAIQGHKSQHQNQMLLQSQMNLNDPQSHGQHQNSSSSNFNFGGGLTSNTGNNHLNPISHQGNSAQQSYLYHQQYMDPQNTSHGYGTGQSNSHPSSSPQMMGNMNQNNLMSHHHPSHNQMSSHQFQQMQHNPHGSFYMPQNNQSGFQ